MPRAATPSLWIFRSLDLTGSPGLVHDFDNTLDYSWTILSATGGLLFNAGEDADTAFEVSLDLFQNDIGDGQFTFGTENGNLMLYFTRVPEPDARAVFVLASSYFWRETIFAGRHTQRRRNEIVPPKLRPCPWSGASVPARGRRIGDKDLLCFGIAGFGSMRQNQP